MTILECLFENLLAYTVDIFYQISSTVLSDYITD